MNIKERVLPLADALRWATYHHVDSNPSEVDEARAALCAALDAADREIERLKSKAEMFEVAFLQMRTALGLDLHSHDNLVDVARELKAENAKLRLDAERYRAIKIRHAYRFVTNMIGDAGYSSHKAPKQIDDFADSAVNEVSEWDSKTEEEKDKDLQSRIDAARAALGQGHD